LIVRVAPLVLAMLLAVAAPARAAPDDGATDAQHAAQERDARQKLDAVRAEIRALADEQRATDAARSDAARAPREKDTEVAAVARDVNTLDAKVEGLKSQLDALDERRGALETALKSQRDALAALLRSAYAVGRDEELKLLLQQNDVAAIARVLAYNRYFQRARIGRIDQLSADLEELAKVQDSIRRKSDELAAARDARSAEAARLEGERSERAALVDQLDAKLKAQGERAAALGKDEKALSALIEKLRDVFADIPRQLTGDVPFASMRGRLPWPLKGRVVTRFGAVDDSGRRSSGLLLAAKAGTPVRAVSHGRVAFADWLRGYGLMIIVDHGDGYLSLYGCNETLLKDVGDWVNAGDTIATSGASGGQKTPGVYFEVRVKGQAVDPKGWLR
jgi:murein hydrolase activator